MNIHLKPVLNIIRKELEIIALPFGFYDSGLCGMCALSAGRVNDVLSTFTNNSTIIVNQLDEREYHVFNMLDGVVIDLTATQFGVKKKVFMEHSSNDWEDKDTYWFQEIMEFGNFDELNEWAIDVGWPISDLYVEETQEKMGVICTQKGIKMAEQYLLKNKLATQLNSTSINLKTLKHY